MGPLLTQLLRLAHAGSSQYLWRANALPPTSSLQYGFTQFAIELNELTDAMRSTLPPTDSRFRPDQRYAKGGRGSGTGAGGDENCC